MPRRRVSGCRGYALLNMLNVAKCITFVNALDATYTLSVIQWHGKHTRHIAQDAARYSRMG